MRWVLKAGLDLGGLEGQVVFPQEEATPEEHETWKSSHKHWAGNLEPKDSVTGWLDTLAQATLPSLQPSLFICKFRVLDPLRTSLV